MLLWITPLGPNTLKVMTLEICPVGLSSLYFEEIVNQPYQYDLLTGMFVYSLYSIKESVCAREYYNSNSKRNTFSFIHLCRVNVAQIMCLFLFLFVYLFSFIISYHIAYFLF